MSGCKKMKRFSASLRSKGSRCNQWPTRSSPGTSSHCWSLHILGVSSLSAPGTFQTESELFVSILSTQNKENTTGRKIKRTRRDGKHCQQPCPATREESMGPNTYYQRRSRPKRPRPPTGTTHASLPPDRSVSAPHMYQRTVPEQKHMATGIWTRANLILSHRGQTLHGGRRAGPAQNQDAAAEVWKANHESSPRRIHPFSKARRRQFWRAVLCCMGETWLFYSW